MKFLDAIKSEIRPKDEVLDEIDRFISKINALLKKEKAKCVTGGSTAKGTFLKEDYDVDLFVIFDYKYKDKEISDILEKAIAKLNPTRVHGSRDYFQLEKKNLLFEIVPVLEVKDSKKIQNITDMSPHHVVWAKKRLTKRLQDEVRLAKKFCKAQKVYGAESYIKGFSGHVIDILIIYYDGFLNLLKSAKNWKPKVIIDVEKQIKDPLKEFDKSKTLGPLIVVDPVQPDRNAAAALSKEKFVMFVKSAEEFIKKPSKSFFERKEFDIKDIKKGQNEIIVLDIVSLDGKSDVVGAKLLKTYDYIKRHIDEFGIVDSDWKWDKKKEAQMYFLIKEKILSKTYVRTGPPLSQKEACKKFKEKNSDVFSKDKRLYANIDRKFRKPKDLIKYLIKTEYIKNKARKINLR